MKDPRFPDCEIFTFPQHSPDWDLIRKDKLTASNFGAWLAETAQVRLTVPKIQSALKKAGIDFTAKHKRDELLQLAEGLGLPRTHLKGTIDSRHRAVCSILGSMSGCEVPEEWEIDPDGPPSRNPSAWSVWNGLRLEKEAVRDFEAWSGETVEMVGFCLHKSGVSGCSPDGLIKGKEHGFEGKAPLPATHVRSLLEGKLPDDYKDQVHGSMAVTGATGWWFQSFCPGLSSFRLFVERDDYTERMLAGLEEFAEALESARLEISALWEAEFHGKDAA